MSGSVTLRIAEIAVETETGAADPEALRRAIEATLEALARKLQARLAGDEEARGLLRLPDLTVREEEAADLLRAPEFRRLVETMLAEIETRIGRA
jgi:hypothetical protein